MMLSTMYGFPDFNVCHSLVYVAYSSSKLGLLRGWDILANLSTTFDSVVYNPVSIFQSVFYLWSDCTPDDLTQIK